MIATIIAKNCHYLATRKISERVLRSGKYLSFNSLHTSRERKASLERIRLRRSSYVVSTQCNILIAKNNLKTLLDQY